MNIMTLEEFKNEFDRLFSAFLDAKFPSIGSVSPHLQTVLQSSKKVWTKGGKRIRPYLSMLAYQGHGGTDVEAVLRASAALEMMHIFALVHDDVIDQSETRRGYQTLHILLQREHEKKALHGDAKHTAESLAILIGDLLFSYANEIAAQMPFPVEIAQRAQKFFYQIQQELVLGEYEDVRATARLESVTENQVIALMSRKSGRYSIEQPLQFGTLLAGKDMGYAAKVFSAFSEPLGIAFQLHDDILGTFGDPKKLGKPIDSDIKQGKPTLMVVHALHQADKKEKERLLAILGNQQASERDISHVRNFLQAKGSEKYARGRAQEEVKKAQEALTQLQGLPAAFTKTLSDLAEFIISRTA